MYLVLLLLLTIPRIYLAFQPCTWLGGEAIHCKKNSMIVTFLSPGCDSDLKNIERDRADPAPSGAQTLSVLRALGGGEFGRSQKGLSITSMFGLSLC